jgi:tetratricopeptide (TPR) repeat protein
LWFVAFLCYDTPRFIVTTSLDPSMIYPGNPALSPDVQQRIRSTFEHTLGLAAGGSRQEALLGCDFVLRMDSQFAPARLLQERIAASMGAVEVEDLRAMLATAAQPAAAEGTWHEFLDSSLPELPELPEVGGPEPAASATAAGAGAGGDLRSELAALLEHRRFQELLARAESARPAIESDPELHRLVTAAQERLEAGPYVVRFLGAARDARRGGDAAEANRLIEKARTLDPSHPGIAELAEPPPAAAPAHQPAADLPFQIEDAPPADVHPAESHQAQVQPAGAHLSQGPPTGGHRSQVQPPGGPHAESLLDGAPQGIDLGGLRTMAIPVYGGAQPAGGDSESERRIRQLLDEGDAALAGGDPQAAIDAWSRIFLIDIDHEEASRRIEQARRVKAENERQVEEIFHDGLARLERRDTSGARRAFERVLELQPAHLAAREYLQQLGSDGGAAVAPPMAPSPGTAAPGARQAPSPTPAPLPASLVQPPSPPAGELKEEILVPPDIGKVPPRAEPRREARAGHAGEGRGRRLFAIIGSAVLLLLAAVGWFVYQNHDRWFPNSQTEEAIASPPSRTSPADPIARARRLHGSGKDAAALSLLRRIGPDDPHYKEAQALIEQWQPAGAPGAAGAGAATAGARAAAGSSPPLAASGTGTSALAGSPDADRRRGLLAEAQKAYGEQRYLVAAQKFDQADRLARLDGPEAASYTDAQQKIAPFARQLTMFRQHDWEYALPELWRLHQADPGNHDINQLIVDCYYDLGVRELQRNDPSKAAGNFNEALNLDRADKSLERHLLFAQTYQERPPDLLYRIYVKYLPMR